MRDTRKHKKWFVPRTTSALYVDVSKSGISPGETHYGSFERICESSPNSGINTCHTSWATGRDKREYTSHKAPHLQPWIHKTSCIVFKILWQVGSRSSGNYGYTKYTRHSKITWKRGKWYWGDPPQEFGITHETIHVPRIGLVPTIWVNYCGTSQSEYPHFKVHHPIRVSFISDRHNGRPRWHIRLYGCHTPESRCNHGRY